MSTYLVDDYPNRRESPGGRTKRLTRRDALADLRDEALPPARLVEIPVCYGGELGPDLEELARTHSLTPDDVVRLHTGGNYLVYMLGFMPGFAYLGGLPPELATPRRSS